MNPFSIIIGIGASIGLWRVYGQSAPAQRIRWLCTGICVLFGSLLGARLVYVLFHLHYYSLYPGEILKFWSGLDSFGAFMGAVFFTIFAGLVLRSGIFRTLDLMTVMLLPIAVAGWLGCWAVGAAYGQALEPGTWWGMLMLDETGVTSLRVPLQPLAAASLILFMFLADRFTRHSVHGLAFAVNCLVFSLHALIFTLMRADPMQTLWGLRLDTVLFGFSLVILVILLIFLLRQKSKTDKMKKYNLQQEVDV